MAKNSFIENNTINTQFQYVYQQHMFNENKENYLEVYIFIQSIFTLNLITASTDSLK